MSASDSLIPSGSGDSMIGAPITGFANWIGMRLIVLTDSTGGEPSGRRAVAQAKREGRER